MTGPQVVAAMRALEWRIDATQRELAATTHARRKAALRRNLREFEVELSRLITELGSLLQEGR